MRLSKITMAAFGLAAALVFAPTVANAAPAAPSGVAQVASTENGFKISWSRVSGATDYTVTIVKDGKVVVGETSTKNSNEFTYKDDKKKTIAAGTTYKVQVKSADASGKSAATEIDAATAPAVMSSFEQVEATENTMKFSWSASAGATGYLVKMGKDAASAKDLKVINTTTINLTGLKADSAYYVAVYPIRKVTDKFYASDKCAFKTKAVTTAGKVTKVKLAEWNVKANYIRLTWKNSAKYEAGYQVQFTDKDDKVVKTYNIRGRKVNGFTAINKKLKNKALCVKVRTYNTLNGKKFYGKWSSAMYLVPQANVTAKKVNATSVELSWTKIPGASKYQVMRATADGGKYKKVANTKKTKYTVKKLKEGQDYYFLVKAMGVKIGGKERESSKVSVPNDIYVAVYGSSKGVEIE